MVGRDANSQLTALEAEANSLIVVPHKHERPDNLQEAEAAVVDHSLSSSPYKGFFRLDYLRASFLNCNKHGSCQKFNRPPELVDELLDQCFEGRILRRASGQEKQKVIVTVEVNLDEQSVRNHLKQAANTPR